MRSSLVPWPGSRAGEPVGDSALTRSSASSLVLLLSVFLMLDEDTPQDEQRGCMRVCVRTDHRTSGVDI